MIVRALPCDGVFARLDFLAQSGSGFRPIHRRLSYKAHRRIPAALRPVQLLGPFNLLHCTSQNMQHMHESKYARNNEIKHGCRRSAMKSGRIVRAGTFTFLVMSPRPFIETMKASIASSWSKANSKPLATMMIEQLFLRYADANYRAQKPQNQISTQG
jgi:hypothetical protein